MREANKDELYKEGYVRNQRPQTKSGAAMEEFGAVPFYLQREALRGWGLPSLASLPSFLD